MEFEEDIEYQKPDERAINERISECRVRGEEKMK